MMNEKLDETEKKENLFINSFLENTEKLKLNQLYFFYKKHQTNKDNISNNNEEKKYFNQFNKKIPNYKLKHYMYFSNNNKDFNYSNYPKFNFNFQKNNLDSLLSYQKFSNLDNKNIKDDLLKNYFKNNNYIGFYSRSLDYINFKINNFNENK